MILYFTGTGNSRFLAKQVAQRLEDEAVDCGALIRQGRHPEFSSQTPYVFVCPTYAWRMPRVFTDWIRSCRFSGDRRAYYLLSCGAGVGAAERYARALSEAMGFTHMGMARIKMPENYVAVFSAPPAHRVPGILLRAKAQAAAAAERIRARQPLERLPVTPLGRLCSGVINDGFYRTVGAEKFYATDACVGCGTCVEACMLNNITLREGRPVWGGSCTHCMACICRCPAGAIEYGSHSKGKRRYVCPEE